MVWFDQKAARSLGRIVIAVLAGWLISWLGVAALITLSVIWPHNPVPLSLLGAWAVLAAASFVIPGASRGGICNGVPVPAMILAAPFAPLLRAALGIWPHLPKAVQGILEGRDRRRRQAKQQGKQVL